MLSYEIKSTGGKHPLPAVEFAEGKYALAAEFLLTEGRSFGREILSALDEVCLDGHTEGSFAGNAFSLAIQRNVTKIINDITDDDCEIPTGEFRRVMSDYYNACHNR